MSFYKKVFKIPVDGMSTQEAQQAVEKLMKEYSENKYDDDFYIPVREEQINLGYGDYWFPTRDDKKDKEKVLDSGVVFADWNKFSMDELADYLEGKWQFMSSGEALAIMKMVNFYRENKNK